MEKYKKTNRIGEGAHGVVYRAALLPQYNHIVTQHHSQYKPSNNNNMNDMNNIKNSIIDVNDYHNDNEEEKKQADNDPAIYVAIKKIRVKNIRDGLSMEAIREIKLLHELYNQYIMPVYDIFMHEHNVNIVMEYMSYDLESLIRATDTIILTHSHIKTYLYMILQSIQCIHSQYIMHRDIKPGNYLISTSGELKLADFGLAKLYGTPYKSHSPQACTLWYRAPELLYGSKSYTGQCDMWSVGCILGELMWRKPLFIAERDKELSQLQVIFAVLGTPTQTQWPNMQYLQNYVEFDTIQGKPLKSLFPSATDDCIDLLSQMLQYNPSTRITAQQALQHRYFKSAPEMTPINQLPKLDTTKKK